AEGLRPRPYHDVLLELALLEKRPDDVLRWYDELTRSKNRTAYWGDVSDERVADAVAATHPDRALAIYKRIVEKLIARTSPSSYQAAAPTMRKIRGMVSAAEWKAYVANLRQTHARKRRLMEVLDRLDDSRIVK